MKQILPTLLLLILTVCLCGCPYESPYNLDEAPLQPVDESLLGKWGTFVHRPGDEKNAKHPYVEIIFDKRTDMDYDIAITGGIEELKPYHVITNDTIKGTAYLSAVAGKQFLNAYILGRVYIAEIIKDGSAISILPIAEYFTSKLIKSSTELRAAVEFHYKITWKRAYDPDFCLKNLQRVN